MRLLGPYHPRAEALGAVTSPRTRGDFSRVAVHSAGTPIRLGQAKGKAWPSDKDGAVTAVTSEETEEEAPAQVDLGEESEAEEDELTSPPAAEANPEAAQSAASGESASEVDQVKDEDLESKAKIEFEVVHAPQPFGGSSDVKTMCAAPRNAPVNVAVGRSTAAQRAAMGACLWGITEPDALQATTRTCRDGASWRLRVRRVRSVVRTFSRQLPGQREPTVGNSTAANFCTQVGDLDGLGNCPGNFYMLAAVRAHEQVHIDEWRTSMGSDWPAQKAIIEGLSVPAAGATRRRSAATAAMRASPAFVNAIRTSRASGNYPAFWGIPDPNVNTDAAERVIVAPRIRQLCVHARNRGWGPAACPVCASNGIT